MQWYEIIILKFIQVKKIIEENLLIIYKQDFRKASVWLDVCTILKIPTDSECAYIEYNEAYAEDSIIVQFKSNEELENDLYERSAE
jgi:hypothetical protein